MRSDGGVKQRSWTLGWVSDGSSAEGNGEGFVQDASKGEYDAYEGQVEVGEYGKDMFFGDSKESAIERFNGDSNDAVTPAVKYMAFSSGTEK